MPQATGIVINNTHLLRAAMLFMVLGVIGPGLFQLQPPQWFGHSGSTDHLEMAAQVTAPPDTDSLSVPATAAPSAPPTRTRAVSVGDLRLSAVTMAAAHAAQTGSVTTSTSAERQSSAFFATSPKSLIGQTEDCMDIWEKES